MRHSKFSTTYRTSSTPLAPEVFSTCSAGSLALINYQNHRILPIEGNNYIRSYLWKSNSCSWNSGWGLEEASLYSCTPYLQSPPFHSITPFPQHVPRDTEDQEFGSGWKVKVLLKWSYPSDPILCNGVDNHVCSCSKPKLWLSPPAER